MGQRTKLWLVAGRVRRKKTYGERDMLGSDVCTAILSSYKIIIKLYLYIYLESMPFNSRNKGNGNKAICILCSDPSRSSTLFYESNEIQND
jgi:hypothetical protein